MNTTKIMWAWLFKYGRIGTPSYYGGSEKNNPNDTESSYLSVATTIGIDWSKTKQPTPQRHLEFAGTFDEPDYTECLQGVLVLKNGQTQDWYNKDTKLEDFLPVMSELIEAISSEEIYKD